jgi:hypothetical protein
LKHRQEVSALSPAGILWTSLPTPEGAVRAMHLGALRYFSKPHDLGGYGSIASLLLAHLGD